MPLDYRRVTAKISNYLARYPIWPSPIWANHWLAGVLF